MLQTPGHELIFAICIFWLNTLKCAFPGSFATDLLAWVNVTLFPISADAALASMCCCRTISISWSNTTFGSVQRSNSSFECGFCNAGVHTATNMWWKASLRAETLSDPWRGPPPSRALSLTLPPCSLFPYFLSAFSEQGGGGCCTEKGFNKQGNGVRGEKKWAGNWK